LGKEEVNPKLQPRLEEVTRRMFDGLHGPVATERDWAIFFGREAGEVREEIKWQIELAHQAARLQARDYPPEQKRRISSDLDDIQMGELPHRTGRSKS
jgi:hypothetical protein